MLVLLALAPAGLAGCATLISEGIARTVNDPGPPATIPMIPLGPRSVAALGMVKEQTEADSSRCEEGARVSAGRQIGSQATRSELAAERYIVCMARQGYRCENPSAHKACETAWAHSTANRQQWRQDSAECLQAVFFVVLASTRHARFVECMMGKGYRADVAEHAGESPAPPEPRETELPRVDGKPGAVAPSQDPARSVRAPASARPSMAPGTLKWPPVGASWTQTVRMSGSFGSGVETRTVRYLGETTWQGKTVRAFSSDSTTTYVDEQRRMLARADASGAPIDSYEPYFILADFPLHIGKWWTNRYRYSDHQWGRNINEARYDGEVDALESVRTRAGTFKAFKITLGGGTAQTVAWYAGELGLVVKMRNERFANHYRGRGVIETELVSYDFKP
ncbi:MAG: hypothetical protein ACRELZ_11740 [Candidatus Rokuibacteriota bacterium]